MKFNPKNRLSSFALGLVLAALAAETSCGNASSNGTGNGTGGCTRSPTQALPPGAWTQPGQFLGKTLYSDITLVTGADLKPFQTTFCIPELADPYATFLKDSVLISGTAQYHLKFQSADDLRRGGPYQVIWNDFYYSDGTPMEGGRYHAHSWDMKPSYWVSDRLWDPVKDTETPLVVWYGGRMQPRPGEKASRWPDDNYSRDVYAFVEKGSGKWFSHERSIFTPPGTPPRPLGNYLGHRYGHQMVMIPKLGVEGRRTSTACVFYEQVTEVRANGSPAVTRIFMDEMAGPFQARGKPVELVSPFHPVTKKPYPSTLREDGSVLLEGPLYFRFELEGEEWEAIGFSAGSFYGNYPALFASRKVADGLAGKPYLPDLLDDGSDFHNAGAELGKLLNLTGGPARPAVLTKADGSAVLAPSGDLQLLVHGYRKDILPDNDARGFPTRYRLDQMFRVAVHALLKIEKRPDGRLRFRIATPRF